MYGILKLLKKVMPNLTQAEGHLIGNHTYSHMQLTKKNREMHDYYDTSVTAVLKVVDELLEEGYVFVTVEEILFERGF